MNKFFIKLIIIVSFISVICNIFCIVVADDTEPYTIEESLIIEPWMVESKTLDSLTISLRSESGDENKKNKNIIALDEEVVYYVDYKNGDYRGVGDVKLILELPLDYRIVENSDGKVRGRNIIWNLENDLEVGECGTKIVTVKYTSLGDYNTIRQIVYPSACIYTGSSLIDTSSIIQMIYKDTKTEIKDDNHYPYMHGDANNNTFRPDDGITRAEGAIVLTRIFGMDLTGVNVVGNEYSDLKETYDEARKAIVAATKIGLIKGYEDGTYRPNRKMTRAEFMKILAANIDVTAKNEGISGLEVKKTNKLIKHYKDSTKIYMVDNIPVEEHWALPYVSLLVRLNMTDVTSRDKDLKMDKEITRAEAAQLINFYLFRAPAEVSSRNTTPFTDVSKNHRLYDDIIEATRPVHTYTLTIDGKEKAIE